MGQPQMKLSGNEHDFGKFKEEAGRQKFDFVVMNTGNQPLGFRILLHRVVVRCLLDKESDTPKGTGKITAIYDPTNRPGKFNKTLSVYTNSKPEVLYWL
jgi:hypothetical protein